MVKHCVICGLSKSDEPGISYHIFPKGSGRNDWINFVVLHGISVHDITATSALCSRHFDGAMDFRPTSKRKCLSAHAIPTIGPDVETVILRLEDAAYVPHSIASPSSARQDVGIINEIVESEVHPMMPQDEACGMVESANAAQVTRPLSNYFSVGELNVKCSKCDARHFLGEQYTNHFSTCCGNGKIVLTGEKKLKPAPEILRLLFTDDTVEAKHFQKEIRNFNNALAFASLIAKDSQCIVHRPGPHVFTIHGQTYHKIGNAMPPDGRTPKYCQLYFIESEQANNERQHNQVNSISLNLNVMSRLDQLLREVNPYAKLFKMMRETWDVEQLASSNANPARTAKTVSMYFAKDASNDRRRYNLPLSNEMAAIFVGDNGNPPDDFDFVVHDKNPTSNNSLQIINYCSNHVDPLLYPLFFPFGEKGWDVRALYEGCRRTEKRTKLTMREFMCFRLAIRYDSLNSPNGAFSLIHQGKFLFQQYCCDCYVRVEANNLNYISQHQDDLRIENYSGLMDHINHQEILPVDPQGCGRRIILPSSYQGSPRAMQQNYQDAMAVVCKFGKPDLFITFTCNPKWPEIQENLSPNSLATDRPDLVARIFNLKLRELMNDITKKNIFGKINAFVYVIEFQKRGLPHAHILLIIAEQNKIRNSEDIDKYVRADLPDLADESVLHDLVTRHMIHGPCGLLNINSPCMSDGKCTKMFPKEYCVETEYQGHGGYPKYKRPDGVKAEVRHHWVGSEFVVPYNPFLLSKYNAHINVEVCSTVKSVKYLYKYVYKGHDRVTVGVCSENEVKTFLNTRYVSAPEAVWRLFSFSVHSRSHVIYRLAVHLEGMQNVIFRDGEVVQAAENAVNRLTTLTGYFALNNSDLPEDIEARQYYYHELPNYYVWNKQYLKWTKRKRNIGTRVIGRMYSVSPSDRERFFLRLLLLNRKNITSFVDMRTINGITYESFERTAIVLGLVENDNVWLNCLLEAAVKDTPYQLRNLFVLICVNCTPSNPLELYSAIEDYLMEDFSLNYSMDQAKSMSLNCINELLYVHSKSLTDFNLPLPTVIQPVTESTYKPSEQNNQATFLLNTLNDDQKLIFNSVLDAVMDDSERTKMFFVDGPGGTGKTTLYKCIISKLRGLRKSVLPVAFTGIAAMLMEGGRTAHSTFGLPFGILSDESTSLIKLNSRRAAKLRDASLIVWDEAPMSPSRQFTVADVLLRDIMKINLPFGGKVILFGGDFRQILPVVSHGTRSDIVNTCIKANLLWQYMNKYSLTLNMRTTDAEYAAWLLKLGEGRLPIVPGTADTIVIPSKFISTIPLEDFVFPNPIGISNLTEYSNKIILCPKNENCFEVNNRILETHIKGITTNYSSIDNVVCDDPEEAANYPMEFLHSLNPSGLPPHLLPLKVGAIVMCLRNLNPHQGLCNGTRLVVTELRDTNFKAKLLNGTNNGEMVIPKIPLSSNEEDCLPFTLRRIQFPVRLAFSVTINKSQGQTFDRVGLLLPSPVFTHGQLYVAFSRVRSSDCIRVQMPNSIKNDNITRNVVYTEVIRN